MVTDFQPVYKRTMARGIVRLHVTMVWLFCGPALHQVESASSDVHLKLLGDLMDNYKRPFMRPVNETTRPVEVGLRFTPIFSTLDERKEELKVRGMLDVTWKDYRLQWLPADYEDINETNIPLFLNDEQTVWIPELTLYECLVTDFHSFYPETTGVTLINTGQIHWYTLATTQTYCKMDNRHFPFDVQTCNLTFTTWMYQSNEQTFYTINDLVKNETYKKYQMDNALWTVKMIDHGPGVATYECETCQGEEQSYVRYYLELTRGHSGLLLFIFVFPVMVISILTTCVTCLPGKLDVDAPSYALTCVLTFFVYLIFLYSKLPPTGVSCIGIFMVLMILGGVFGVFYAVLFKHDRHLDVCRASCRKRCASTREDFEMQPANYEAASTEGDGTGQGENDGNGTENVETDYTNGAFMVKDKDPIVSKQGTTSTNIWSKCSFCCRSVGICRFLFIAYQVSVIISMCIWVIVMHKRAQTRT